jgi:hypothetical protein
MEEYLDKPFEKPYQYEAPVNSKAIREFNEEMGQLIVQRRELHTQKKGRFK